MAKGTKVRHPKPARCSRAPLIGSDGKKPEPGWGYPQIGWLLDEVKNAGGSVPEEYYPVPRAQADGVLDPMRSARCARIKLGRKLSAAFTIFGNYSNLMSTVQYRRRAKSLKSLQGQVGRILRANDADPMLFAMLHQYDAIEPNTGVGIGNLVRGLVRLRDAAKALEKDMANVKFPVANDKRTPQEYLFRRLAKVYSKQLKAKPTRGLIKTYNKPSGPFVAFIRAAYQLDQKPPLADAAMYKALQRAGFIIKADKA